MAIIIEQYSAKWAADFNRLKQLFLKALDGLPVCIEHVGSTSVPGLAAKPVLDIDIVLEDEQLFARVCSRLQGIGYRHAGNQGIDGREVFKLRTGHAPCQQDDAQSIKHHLYVCHKESVALQNHLLFRDYLRKNPAAIVEYEALKRHLAAQKPDDMEWYASQKTSFIISLLRKAGMQEQDLASIAGQNNNL